MGYFDEQEEAEERGRIANKAFRRGVRDADRMKRQQRAQGGWFNWYVNRGRLSLTATDSELRRVSWRRAH